MESEKLNLKLGVYFSSFKVKKETSHFVGKCFLLTSKNRMCIIDKIDEHYSYVRLITDDQEDFILI